MVWNFDFSNGSTCHYRFYTITVDNVTNTEVSPVNNDTLCYYNNTRPNVSSNPSPSNGTTFSTGNIPLSFSWLGGDIDNDTVNYTIYLKAGSSSFTLSDIEGYTENTSNFSVSVSWSKTYYWKIIATDEHGATSSSPLWYFTTGAQSSGGSSPSQGSTPPVEDDEEEKGSEPSEITMNYIESHYNITFEEKFYANDTDGDGIFDTLTDPNGVLTEINFVNINGNISVLLSTNDDEIPEFFWDVKADTITPVNHALGEVTDTNIDTEEETLTNIVIVNKSDWIYIEIADQYPPDQYPDYTLIVKNESGKNISSDMVWRENRKIYVLEDPDTQYEFIYGYTVLDPVFMPSSEETFNIAQPTIAMTYQEQVDITLATFGHLNITDQITNLDNLTFLFTPQYNLANGTYILNITSQDTDGNNLTSTAIYEIQATGETSTYEKQDEGFPLYFIIPMIVIIAIIIIVVLFKTGTLYFAEESVKKDTTKKEETSKTGKDN